jgi:hypothetical protein
LYLFSCGAALLLPRVKADVLSLEVKGYTAVNHNDIAGARDGAIRKALQRAIEDAASALLSLPVNDKKFLSVKNALIERQDRYINNYKITAEGGQEGTYFVVVNVSVAVSDLKNDLAKMAYRQIAGQGKNNIIISLEIKGLKSYSDFLFLKEFLKGQSKIVKNICSRSFEWQQARLELEISGTAQSLALELAKTGRYLNTGLIKKNQIVVTCLLQEEREQ